MNQLFAYLESVNLTQYYELFSKEKIDFDFLRNEMDKEDLKFIGVPFRDIKTIITTVGKYQQTFTKKIDEYPEFIKILLEEYDRINNLKIKLWAICDFYEILLRFNVLLSISYMHLKDIQLTEKDFKLINSRIKFPTMGIWFKILKTLGKDIYLNHELIAMNRMLVDVVNLSDTEINIISLRNNLAHGGTFKYSNLEKLVAEWEGEFQKDLNTFSYLRECQILEKDDEIYFKYKDMEISLVPFLMTNRRNIYELYLRMDKEILDYTPIHNDETFEEVVISSDKKRAEEFSVILKNLYKENIKKEFEFEGLSLETIIEESNQLFGRRKDIKKVIDILENNKNIFYWVTGNPGSGKSFFMSGIINALSSREDHQLLLSYRFIADKNKYSKNSFIKYAIERLLEWSGIDEFDRKINKQSTNLNDLFYLINHIREEHEILFFLDGIDEMSKKDLKLIEKIYSDLVLFNKPKCKWLFFSRPEENLKKHIEDENTFLVYENGLGKLKKAAVNEIIFNRIDRSKYDLVAVEEKNQENNMFNPFLDKVYELSDGSPLYINYLIGDILSKRIDFSKAINLPPTIEAYTYRLLNDYNINELSEYNNFIISLLYFSNEALPFEVLMKLYFDNEEALDTEEAKINFEKSFNQLRPILSKESESIDRGIGYILFHKKLNEALATNKFSQLVYAQRNKLIRILNNTENKIVRKYDYKWLFKLILDMKETKSRNKEKKIKLLESRLENYDYIKDKFKIQEIENFIDDFYDLYNILTNSYYKEKIKELLMQLLLDEAVNLDFPELNATLMYKNSRDLYVDLLRMISNEATVFKEVKSQAILRLISLIRRQGKIDEAKTLGDDYKLLIEEHSNLKNLSIYAYEIGYIYYLEGKFNRANDYFTQSINYSIKGKDFIGEQMTRCVRANTKYIHNPNKETSGVFEEVLSNALNVFVKYSDEGNLDAKRWIFNVYAHQFKLRVHEGKCLKALEAYERLKNNPWIQKYRKQWLDLYHNYLNYCQGKYSEVTSFYEKYFKSLSEKEIIKSESIAKDYLYYIIALYNMEQENKITDILSKVDRIPENNGNKPYLETIQLYVKENNILEM